MVDLPYEETAAQWPSWIFICVSVTFFMGSAIWAGCEAKRFRNALPFLALGGGFIAALEEPWINTLIQLWYPRDAPMIVFIAMEHAQPLYVYLVYPGFVGLGAYMAYRSLVANPDGRNLWKMYGGIVVLDLLFELPATASGAWSYYGPQPLQLVSDAWPMWVASINAAGPVLGGWLIYQVVMRTEGATRAITVLFMPPMAYAAVFGAAGWPTYTMLKTDVSDVARWAAAFVTIGLCTGIVYLIKTTASAQSDSNAVAPEISK